MIRCAGSAPLLEVAIVMDHWYIVTVFTFNEMIICNVSTY